MNTGGETIKGSGSGLRRRGGMISQPNAHRFRWTGSTSVGFETVAVE
jgi:hypothetical protein